MTDAESKFFTNEPERDLYGKFQSLLRGQAKYCPCGLFSDERL